MYLSERMTVEKSIYAVLKIAGEAAYTTRNFQKTLPNMLSFRGFHY
jgi:hypothetical protein